METPKNAVEAIGNPIHEAMLGQGITPLYLARKLKRELNAKEPKIVKVKGAVNPDSLPRGYKIRAQSGMIIHSAEGGQDYGDGETVIEYKVDNIGIAQKARMDAHKLRGDYPIERHELNGSITVTPQLTEEDRKILKSISKKAVDDILQQHRESIKRGR
jgi:hypothetical protein